MNESFDDNIRKKIKSLDDDFPQVDWTPEDVWTRVGKRERVVRYVGWSLAAAIVIAGVIFFLPSNKETVTITFRRESLQPVDTTINRSGWDYIEESCRAKMIVCESKEFIELKKQWDELEREHQQLLEQQKTYGGNPALTKAMQKVASVRMDLENEMKEMIQS
jgi:tetrahydromethanopterin S-methyltransferase subunit G